MHSNFSLPDTLHILDRISDLAVKASFLLTLGRRLVEQVNQVELPLQALAPGDFIRTVLPHHVRYPSLRSPY